MAGRTPDEFPGTRKEDVVQILSGAYVPTNIGEFAYVSGSGFQFLQDDGIALLRSGAINSVDHKTLRQLIHLADGGGPFEGFTSGATLEIGPQPFPTASIWRTSDTKKLVQKTITRNSKQIPTTIQWQVFDTNGTSVLATVTDTISYINNVFETSRTRTIT